MSAVANVSAKAISALNELRSVAVEMDRDRRAFMALIEKQDVMLEVQKQMIKSLQAEIAGFYMEVADLIDRIRSFEQDLASLRSGIDHPDEHS